MAEYFFTSRVRPRILFELNLLVVRLRVWGPYPFVSLTAGPLWRSDDKVKAFQAYLGVKCDGTRTARLWPLGYQMVLTPKELAAWRLERVATTPHWSDQGGS